MLAGSANLAGAGAVRVTAGGHTIALPTRSVRAITRVPPLTRVPHAPPSMVGLANVGGTVLPVISLARLLERPETTPTRLVVFEGTSPCGLLVEGIGAIATENQEEDGSRDIDERLATIFAATQAPLRSVARSATPIREEIDDNQVSFLSFRVGAQEFALPAAQVSEVFRLSRALTPLPGGDRVALGTVSHRGELLPVLSLAGLLNLPAGTAERPYIVITNIARYRVGLAVDALGGVVRASEKLIDPVPTVLQRNAGEARIQAICRLEEGRRLISVIAAEQLVDQELTARLQQQSGRSTMLELDSEKATRPFLAFRIGSGEFALPIDAVDEIVRLPAKLTRLPTAPPFIEGVMNLRGQVIPVIDQGRRFDSDAAGGSGRRVIVVKAGPLRAGFIVDAVSEVMRVADDLITAAPEMQGEHIRLFEGVVTLDEGKRLLLIVSPQELLNRAERDVLAQLVEGAAVQHA